MYKQTRSAGFGKEVKRRIILGTYVLSSGYYDAYYRKAGQVRTLIRRDFDRAFEQCDVIVTPVSPTTAFKIGEKTEDPLTMYLSDIFTIPVNLAGLPAISLPCGFDGKGLPIGVSDHREAPRRNAPPAGGLSPGGGEKAEENARYVRVTMDTLDPQRFLSALLHMGIDRYVSGRQEEPTLDRPEGAGGLMHPLRAEPQPAVRGLRRGKRAGPGGLRR